MAIPGFANDLLKIAAALKHLGSANSAAPLHRWDCECRQCCLLRLASAAEPGPVSTP